MDECDAKEWSGMAAQILIRDPILSINIQRGQDVVRHPHTGGIEPPAGLQRRQEGGKGDQEATIASEPELACDASRMG